MTPEDDCPHLDWRVSKYQDAITVGRRTVTDGWLFMHCAACGAQRSLENPLADW